MSEETAPGRRANEPHSSSASRGSLWLIVLVVGLGLFEVTRRAALATDNPRLLPAMVLFGALVVPASFLCFVWGQHIRHDVTAVTALSVAAVGGCLSVATAAVLENAALQGNTFGARGELPPLAVGVLEEGAKLLVTVVVLLVAVPRTPVNGLLVGIATGTGFAVLETLGYAFADYTQSGGGMVMMETDLLFRSVVTPATHVAWAGLTGCALGYAASRWWRPGPTLLCLGTFGVVVVLHTLWDRPGGSTTYVPLTALGLALLGAVIRMLRRRPPSP
ncbi:MAG: PrsW family glutamic-type intramembrane protease [Terracoccus sp.]